MSEIDKTIEELEAEVMAELQEEEVVSEGAHDAPKKGANPGDPAPKMDKDVEDLGKAITSPTDAKSASAKAADSAKPATGDPAQKDAEPGDKEAEMLKAMYKKMEGMHGKELKAMYNQMMGMHEGAHEEDEEEDEETAEMKALKKEKKEARIKEINVKEDVEALISNDDNLSEEFKTKAATIFEAAVKSKVRGEIDRLDEEYDKELSEKTEEIKSELVEKIDSYLAYVTEEWMKENELAIERGLKGEIAEDFISGLKQLFEDHYVDVPEEKYDVLDGQSKKIEELEEKLNDSIEKNKQLHEQIGGLTKDSIINEVSEDLTDLEIEKFRGLIEDVDYSDADSYKEKLSTLKESYFPKQQPVNEQSTEEQGESDVVETSDSMAKYLEAISKTHNRAKN